MFSNQDYKLMLKVRKAPVSLMNKDAALLWNIELCLQHGGDVQSYFSVLFLLCVSTCMMRSKAPLVYPQSLSSLQ